MDIDVVNVKIQILSIFVHHRAGDKIIHSMGIKDINVISNVGKMYLKLHSKRPD